MSILYFEPRALDLAEAFGRMAPEPTKSPAAAFDLTLNALGAMLQDWASPRFAQLYLAASDIAQSSPMFVMGGRMIDTLEHEVNAGLTAGFKQTSQRVPGGWCGVVIDTTAQQGETLSRLKSGLLEADVSGAEYGSGAYSISVRYLVGLAHQLRGTKAPDDCSLPESTQDGVARKLYVQLHDGGYAERRIRGLNF